MIARCTGLLLCLILFFCGARADDVAAKNATGSDTNRTATVPVEVGDLRVLFRDNSQSPRILSGLQSLFHNAAPTFDAFDPEGQGASAGLNFEHIIAGHTTPSNRFTPRHGVYTIEALPAGQGARLTRKAADSPWKVDSTLTYSVREPHAIDVDFRCQARDAKLFGERRYGIFFFADYMNDVADIALHFRGVAKAGAEESWIAGDAPETRPDWVRGGTYRAVDAEPLEYDEDHNFKLNVWSYDYPRFTKPFYFGRAAHDMVFLVMFDRMVTEDDEIRFSLFKFKLPQKPRPAWDFQYVIRRVEEDKEYGFRARVVWKKFRSADDCLMEYEKWSAGLLRK